MIRQISSPDPLTQRLSFQTLLYASSAGVFATGSALFFTQTLKLSVNQVGSGYSVMGIAGLLTSLHLGRLADRIGPKNQWAAAAILEGIVFLSYPSVNNFGMFLGFMTVVGLLSAAAGSARSGYSYAVAESRHRVTMQAYLRTAFNIGLSIGIGIGGIILFVGSSRVMVVVPVITGLLMLVNGFFVIRLPASPVNKQVGNLGLENVEQPQQRVLSGRFIGLSIVNGIMNLHQTLLIVVIPLWIVTKTAAPHGVLAALLFVNTLLVITAQVPLSRRVMGIAGSARAIAASGVALAVSCFAFLGASYVGSFAAVTLVMIGCVVLTVAEIYHSNGTWGLIGELAPTGRRSEFQGLFDQGSRLESMAGPMLFTFLVMTWGALGWAVIMLISLSAGLLVLILTDAKSRVSNLDLKMTSE